MSGSSGRNYTIDVSDDGIAVARVRRRPDLDTNAGAEDAQEMVAAILVLAASGVDALVLDLIDAPPIAGPRTMASLESLLRGWADGGGRVVVTIGASAVQRLQMEFLVTTVGSPAVRVMGSVDPAVAWLGLRA
ncbi:MAG: hypothetical protein IAG13_32685 [Deltaproteobacteria bacterium]|nr:hypothetical protein [Nannocystaceae bacterium]